MRLPVCSFLGVDSMLFDSCKLISMACSLPMQVRMRDLGVHVASFPCGSLDIKVQSSGLLMTDTRKAGGSEGPVAVVNIGGMEDAAPVRCAISPRLPMPHVW